jgi:hypothetical protein
MRKEDFNVGQTVFLKYVGDSRWKKDDDLIKKAEVKSIGRKYITVTFGYCSEYKFDMTNNFAQVYDVGYADYVLYLSEDEIKAEEDYNNLIDELRHTFPNYGYKCSLTADQLQRIKEIVNESRS